MKHWMVALLVACTLALSACPGSKPPVTPTPNQAAAYVKQTAITAEKVITDLAKTMSAIRDAVRVSPLTAQQKADFEAGYKVYQQKADATVTLIETTATNTNPALKPIHDAIQNVASVVAPLLTAAQPLAASNTLMTAVIAAAQAALATALQLTTISS